MGYYLKVDVNYKYCELSNSSIKMKKIYYSSRPGVNILLHTGCVLSQSTIKMDKGYYQWIYFSKFSVGVSQSTIKMDKGYY